MLKRSLTFVSILTTLTLALGVAVALAQELSDKEHLDKGIELFNNKKYAEALDHLKEVDASKLSRFDQDKPALYIQRAGEAQAKQQEALGLMQTGRLSLRNKQYAEALATFDKAHANTQYLGAADAKTLESLIILAKRGQEESGEQPVTAPAAEPAATAEPVAPATPAQPVVEGNGTNPVVTPTPDVVTPVVNASESAGAMQPAVETASEPAAAPATAPAAEPVLSEMVPAPSVTATESQPATVVTSEPAATPVAVPAAPVTDMDAVRRQAIAARVEAELAAAKQAMDDQNWTRAAMAYTNALSLDPNNAAAQAGKAKADGMMGLGPKSLLAKESDWITVQIQETEAKVRTELNRAKAAQAEAREPADYAAAIDHLRQAQTFIKGNRYLSPTMREDMTEEVMVLWAAIEQAKADRVAEIDRERDVQIADRIREREDRDQKNRDRQIQSLWTTARQYSDVREYQKAADVLDQLLVIDAQNERARRFRDDCMYWAGMDQAINIRVNRNVETAKALKDTEKSATPWTDIYRYMDAREWADLTRRRAAMVASSQGDSEEANETRRRMSQKGLINGVDWSIHLNMTESTLENVLNFIREVARAKPREINILVDTRGIEDAGGDLQKTMTLDQKDISIEQALKMVLGSDLGYAIQDDGTVVISALDKLNENLPVRTYFVQDLITPIPDFGRTVPRMQLSEALEGAEGGGGGGIFGDDDDDDDETPGTEVLQQLIERTVRSTEPWESLGGRATIEFYEKSGLMIVSQTAEGHRKLSDLLESLRRERAIMVSIEARFLTVSDSFLNDVTFDFDVAFLHNIHSHWRQSPLATDNPETLPGGSTLNNLPGLIDLATGLPTTAAAQSRPLTLNSTSSNGMGVNRLMPGLQSMNAPFANFLANEGGMALSGVFLDEVQVGFLIRAIQADIRSTTLFAPRLTLWNGQRAWIADGTRFGFVGDLEPVVAEAAVAWDPTIEYITAGSLLDVKATVSADRRYVHLDLRPQVTQTPAFRLVPISAAASGMGIASAVIEVPTVRITEMQTSVSVPDGGTLLIGGLKMFEEHDVESGVPIFSKIPALKRLFTNRGLQRGHQNMLILVKPTIIIQSEEEAKLGTDEWDS
ncbi:MAG: hypothetical protein GXY74_04335 [Phycisphaerae bacterium]|nr:hypothetical protein [Phycisphaerae bacterium]